jgi:hypothetical protein
VRLLLSLLIAAASVGAASAQEAPMPLSRLSGPITVDGMPDEPAWQQVPALPLTMYAPVFRGTPAQRTEIRVAYDDEYLYVGGWFYDTEPAGIRINSLYRDRWNGDDALAIYIDGFNDNRNAKWFGVTPAGMRFDQLVSDDGATLNENWDGFWSASTRITGEGWFAEVRIPFSTIGFHPDSDGRAVMGMTLTRLVSRSGERVTFPAIDPAFEFRRPSLARDVTIEGVRSRTPVYVTPYALTGTNRTTTPGALGFDNTRKTEKEVGLDVRYPMSGNLTLDLTVNTDFAQVEADEQQVALDRFPLFYPERRRFFQEGAGLFDFVSYGGGRLFHSRRIGLASDLTTVPILGGGRLVGRAGGWDLGALEVQTDASNGRPGENFGVLRLRHPVLNRWSTAGLMLTSYSGGDHQNFALGADTTLRPFGDHYLDVKWAGTFDDRDVRTPSLVERSLVDARWQRRTGRGLSYTAQFTRAGDDYKPELGFMPREDFTTANLSGNYYFFTDKHRVFKRVYPGALTFSTFRNSDKALESGQYAVWVQWDTKAGGGGWVEPKVFHENVLAPFTIGNAITIPAGVYEFADLQVRTTMAQGRKLRTDVDFRSGTYFDGTRTQVIFAPTWNVSRYLEVGGDYQLSALRFPVRGQECNIQLARFRIRTAATARASANAFVQYNSTTDRVDLNLRLRYAFAEGTDLWIVYNEGLDTEPTTRFDITQPRSLARALIIKYTHTLGFSR